MRTRTFDAVIIGGGAAGLFCAVQLCWRGVGTAVIEHSDRFARKLRITGKGRCNVTNNCSRDEVLQNITRNSRFMFSSVSRFQPEDTMSFFESLGVPLKTERGNRVFPVSDKASDIAEALIKACTDGGAELATDEARELIIENGEAVGVRCKNAEYRGRVIIACGGKSYPATGSTGDGYKFASQAGHRVTKLTPSLCPIVTDRKAECAEAMGLSLKNCTLTLRCEGESKPLYKELGEMLLHISGFRDPSSFPPRHILTIWKKSAII